MLALQKDIDSAAFRSWKVMQDGQLIGRIYNDVWFTKADGTRQYTLAYEVKREGESYPTKVHSIDEAALVAAGISTREAARLAQAHGNPMEEVLKASGEILEIDENQPTPPLATPVSPVANEIARTDFDQMGSNRQEMSRLDLQLEHPGLGPDQRAHIQQVVGNLRQNDGRLRERSNNRDRANFQGSPKESAYRPRGGRGQLR